VYSWDRFSPKIWQVLPKNVLIGIPVQTSCADVWKLQRRCFSHLLSWSYWLFKDELWNAFLSTLIIINYKNLGIVASISNKIKKGADKQEEDLIQIDVKGRTEIRRREKEEENEEEEEQLRRGRKCARKRAVDSVETKAKKGSQ
jgi:hypothetical protein